MSKKTVLLEKQFLSLYEAFSQEIFRFCFAKTRNRDESLDITQEVFMKTWDVMRQGKTIDMARGFLYKIARNAIIDRSRKKKSISLEAIFDDRGDSFSEITEHVAYEKTIDQEKALIYLKQLPEHHYEILVLRYIQELTITEIAQLYQETENAISVKIHRALKVAQKNIPEFL